MSLGHAPGRSCRFLSHKNIQSIFVDRPSTRLHWLIPLEHYCCTPLVYLPLFLASSSRLVLVMLVSLSPLIHRTSPDTFLHPQRARARLHFVYSLCFVVVCCCIAAPSHRSIGYAHIFKPGSRKSTASSARIVDIRHLAGRTVAATPCRRRAICMLQ